MLLVEPNKTTNDPAFTHNYPNEPDVGGNWLFVNPNGEYKIVNVGDIEECLLFIEANERMRGVKKGCMYMELCNQYLKYEYEYKTVKKNLSLKTDVR